MMIKTKSTADSKAGSIAGGVTGVGPHGRGTPWTAPPLSSAATADVKRLVEQQFDHRAPSYDHDNTYHPPLAEKLIRIAALSPGCVLGAWSGVAWGRCAPLVVNHSSGPHPCEIVEPNFQLPTSNRLSAILYLTCAVGRGW